MFPFLTFVLKLENEYTDIFHKEYKIKYSFIPLFENQANITLNNFSFQNYFVSPF